MRYSLFTSAVSYTCKMFMKSTPGEEVAGPTSTQKTRYRILWSIVRTFFTKNDAEILPAHYTWKVAFTNLFINKVFRENCKMKVHAILTCTLYSIKCGAFILMLCHLVNRTFTQVP